MARRSAFIWPTGDDKATFTPTGAATAWQAVAKPASTPGGAAPSLASFISYSGATANSLHRFSFAPQVSLAPGEYITWLRPWVYGTGTGGEGFTGFATYQSGSQRPAVGVGSSPAVQVNSGANPAAGWYSGQKIPARSLPADFLLPLSSLTPLFLQLQNTAAAGTMTVYAVALEVGISTMPLANMHADGIDPWNDATQLGSTRAAVEPVYGVQYFGDGAATDSPNPGSGCWWEQQDVDAVLRNFKQWGWNVLRTGVPQGLMMTNQTTPNVARFQALAAFLDKCEDYGVRVILTTNLWNPNIRDTTAWGLDALSEAARWTWQQLYFFNLAKYCGYSPAILLYDLASEAQFTATTTDPGTWYSGSLGGYTFNEYITRTNANHAPATQQQAATDWMAKVLDTTLGLKACDVSPRVSMGLGFLGSNGWEVVQTLTNAYLPHIYPSPNRTRSLAASWLDQNKAWANKPVIIEEFSNLGGMSQEDIAEVIGGIALSPNYRLAGVIHAAWPGGSSMNPSNARITKASDYFNLPSAMGQMRAQPLAKRIPGRHLPPRAAQRVGGIRQTFNRLTQRF